MQVLVVYAHPEPESFNGAMFRTSIAALTEAGNSVATSDLYAMGFDPASGRQNFTEPHNPDYLKLQLEEMNATQAHTFAPALETEIAKLEAAELLVFQFPLWWFGLPAILKGWVDRVFAMGRTYGGGHIYDTGKFRGRRALVSTTTGGPREAYLPDGFNGDIMGILRPIHRGILQFVGFDVLAPEVHYGPVRVSPDERQEWLAAWAERLRGITEESPIEVGRY